MSHHEIPAPTPTPCPTCGGERFVAEGVPTVLLVPRDSDLPTFPSGYAQAWALANGSSRLWALVCAQCGQTDLFAKDPSELRRKAN